MIWLAHMLAGSLYAVSFASFLTGLLEMTHVVQNDTLFGLLPFDKIIAVISIGIVMKEYLQQSGAEFNEIIISNDTLNDTMKSSDIIESALNSAQPDLLIVGATISKFSFLTDTLFVNLLYQFKCPVIVARHFSIPGVHKLKSFIVKVLRLSS